MLRYLRQLLTPDQPGRRLRDVVAWDEPWDYEDDDAEADPLVNA